MPIYEYRRPDGSTFEIMQRITEDTLTEDPENPGVPVERVFHPIAVHFKGKGFYNTDYGKKRRGTDGHASTDAGSDATSSSNGGSSDSGGDSSSSESKSSSDSSSDSSSKSKSSSTSKD